MDVHHGATATAPWFRQRLSIAVVDVCDKSCRQKWVVSGTPQHLQGEWVMYGTSLIQFLLQAFSTRLSLGQGGEDVMATPCHDGLTRVTAPIETPGFCHGANTFICSTYFVLHILPVLLG